MKPHNQHELNIITMRFKYLFAFYLIILLSLMVTSCTTTEEAPNCKCGKVTGFSEAFSPQRGVYYKVYIKTDCGTIVRDSNSKSTVGSNYCEN